MTEIISVRFKEGGKTYYFNPNGLQIAEGQKVIIETSRGVEFGECAEANRMIDERELVSPLRPVMRLATAEDFAVLERNKEKEARAFEICQQKIAEHELDMKLVDMEYSFDGSKILFYFTSDGRVDFRALVHDLASIFHTRIELRQIGVRDEAKMLGGLGICGRPFCCTTFLEDFHPVSIKMAKTQNLSLNPTKISGTCGRLMCCLKYEQEAYEDVLQRTPKLESLVETPDGVGVVTAVQLLREKVKVILDLDPENPQFYDCSEIKIVRNGKGKRPEGYELPDPAEIRQREQPRLRNTTLPEQSDDAERRERPSRREKPAADRRDEPAAAEKPKTGKPRQDRERDKPKTDRPKNEKPKAEKPVTEAAEAVEAAQDSTAGKSEKNKRFRRRRKSSGERPAAEGQQTEAVSAPKSPDGDKAQGEKPAQAQANRSRRSRSHKPKQPNAEQGAGSTAQAAAPKAQSAEKQAGEQAQGGGNKSNRSRSYHRRRHGSHPKDGQASGSAPKSE